MITTLNGKEICTPPAPYKGEIPPRGMRLWVDDLREPDHTWTWAKTSAGAIALLETFTHVTAISLDHDLGGNDTARPVVMWMIENKCWPEDVRCHSANPVGRHWIEAMVTRYRDWEPNGSVKGWGVYP